MVMALYIAFHLRGDIGTRGILRGKILRCCLHQNVLQPRKGLLAGYGIQQPVCLGGDAADIAAFCGMQKQKEDPAV